MLFNIPLRKIKIGLLLLIGLLVAAIVPASVIGRSKYAPATDLAVGALGAGMLCYEGSTAGPVTTFELRTASGHFSSPDGNHVYMWGYQNPDPAFAGAFQMPGPTLCVDEGQEVKVQLTYEPGSLLTGSVDEPSTSLVFPGQTGVTTSSLGGTTSPGLFTLEAEPGGTVEYSFIAGKPGTYLYESGTEQHKQVHMGLLGALIVRPAMGDQYAYNAAGTEFNPDWEYLMLIHEIDPTLHSQVERGEDYTITEKHDRYWTINGRSFPDVIAPNNAAWLPGQPYSGLVLIEAKMSNSDHPLYNALDYKPALIRYLNAGLENHPFHPHGNNMTVVGRDGRKLDIAFDNFTTSIGAGQTYDMLFTWEDKDYWSGVIPQPANSEPLPSIPDYLNRVYKDGTTFSSGSAYLGDSPANPNDYFPVDTTNYNVCGEYYFPWHSHALHEIQNFDEGFGGMITAVGVFPPEVGPYADPLTDPCAPARP